MAVTRLYHPHQLETGQCVELDKNASHHLVRVMRNRKDSPVILFNGDGFEYTSIQLNDNPRNCCVRIENKAATRRESPVHITLIQGISRSDRMDICIQKSTELGINTFIPVNCERSTTRLDKTRLEKKQAHWQQVMISACEQSGRCVLPTLDAPTSYEQAIAAVNDCEKFVLDPEAEQGLGSFAIKQRSVCLVAGPEGGLTSAEIGLARDNDFQPVRLGPRILRTETAGPASISAIQTLWGDLG